MKKNILLLFMILTLPLSIRAQNYTMLWKQVSEAGQKDLPRTQIDLLTNISAKARKEKSYGNLLAAELQAAGLWAQISPDSIFNQYIRLKKQAKDAERQDETLAAVYNCVLSKIAPRYNASNEDGEKDTTDYVAKSLANPALLAEHQYTEYQPLLIKGTDDKIFNNDLLHVIAMEVGKYDLLDKFYSANGNREAACYAGTMAINSHPDMQTTGGRKKVAATLDSLMQRYGDLPISAEIALCQYNLLVKEQATTREKIGFIDKALARWGTWKGMDFLRNVRETLTAPMFDVNEVPNIVQPGKVISIKDIETRNINDLKLTITRTTLDGNTDLDVDSDKELTKIKSACIHSTKQSLIRTYQGHETYEVVKDSLTIPALQTGVYLMEFASSSPRIRPRYSLLYVSNVYVISERQPNETTRYAVVNATTGQPIANAKLLLTFEGNYREKKTTKTLTTNKAGEAFLSGKLPDDVFAYTDKDKACPSQEIWNNFSYYKRDIDEDKCNIYTDRRIYRPGQTVHAAVIVYHQKQDETKVVEGKAFKLRLRDANYETIAEKEVTTDQFGTAATDFELPTNGLTGNFIIDCSLQTNGYAYFNVEEYKRPTFDVSFDEYKEKYVFGDTIKVKGHAKTYSGVPVQGAKVEYTIIRRQSRWWRWYGESEEELFSDNAVTDADGNFEAIVPFTFPNDEKEHYYNFIVEATVTDIAGESHQGTISLPLGSKTTILTSNLPTQSLANELQEVKFNYLNAAGQPIDGMVKYAILPYKDYLAKAEYKNYTSVAANQTVKLGKFSSGKYHFHAICETDTLDTDVVLFSLTDKQPVVETHAWFYPSDRIFPRDGKPVYIQVGSSDKDVHVFYTVYAEDRIIETGAFEHSNAIRTFKYSYKPEYGDGLHLTFAWVKEGKLYEKIANINKPSPAKQLEVTWKTFRDRLIPGQQEEWTISVKQPDGKAANAQLMATLYDKSLDKIIGHSWSFAPSFWRSLASSAWRGFEFTNTNVFYTANYNYIRVKNLSFAQLDEDYTNIFGYWHGRYGNRSKIMIRGAVSVKEEAKMFDSAPKMEMPYPAADTIAEESSFNEVKKANYTGAATTQQDKETKENKKANDVQLRENLNETAFFYPQLVADGEGNICVKFTLPESLTTWKFMGIAHDKEVNSGYLEGEAVAKKTVMVQPNLPRFVRQGDEATISTRIINTSDKTITGKAMIELIDPATEKIVYTDTKNYELASNATSSVTFALADILSNKANMLYESMLIARITAAGEGYSDGEQHYLPVLPNSEYVTNTYPFTQIEPGTKTIDLSQLFPKNTTRQRLTVEYTNNPNWLMIQALPYVSDLSNKNAIDLAAAYFTNRLGKKIIGTSQKIRETINQWKKEKGNETSMMSALEKNQDLKELTLNETPWVADARNESEQKQMLVRYFDENQLQSNLSTAINELQKLQNPDGSFSWWKGMRGSLYMTVYVTKSLVRLNTLTGEEDINTKSLLKSAFRFLDKQVGERVKEMKKLEKKGYKHIYPSDELCDYLYTNALANRPTTADITYLINLLAKKPVNLTIYGKANTAVILQQYNKTEKAKEYLQSIKEYTVYKEEMGRYFDSRNAYYSWRDYKIPTQVAAIEAIKTITPNEKQTLMEMQRWLLQSKRTQAWDTPINSLNAIWAFMDNGNWTMDNGEDTRLTINGKPLETSQATAGIGYVKSTQPVNFQPSDHNELTAEKTSTGTSWGAVYAQFFQPSTEIANASAGLTIKREVLGKDGKPATALKVGDKISIRLTIKADRDYDFVQVIDKRAACLEPVNQLSGYNWGYYIAPKDYTTNYYFDGMAKGTHVVEAEYFVDREGSYQTGTCIVQCAYASEFTGRTGATILKVKK